MHTVVFGDSIAKGIVTVEGRIETIEDNAVKLISDYYQRSIDNVSFYGQTLKRIYDKKIVDKYLSSINDHDEIYAVFALGGNDSDYDWKKVSDNPYFAHQPKTNIEDFEFMLIDMIKKLQSKGIKVVLTTIIPLDSQSYFDHVISKMGDPEKIMIFLKNDVENISRHQEAYSHVIQRCAKETQSICLDVRSKMEKHTHVKRYMCADGVHPNEEGYHYLAQSIIGEINSYEMFDQWRRMHQTEGLVNRQ